MDLVRRAYAALARGDVEWIAGVLTDDVVYDPPVGEAMHGREAVVRVMRELPSIWSEYEPEAQEFIAGDELVVVLGRYRCRARRTGLLFEAPFAVVCTLADGEIARVQEFTKGHELARALGVNGDSPIE